MFKKKKLKKHKKTKNILNYISYFWFIIIFVLLIFIIWKNYNFDIYSSILEIKKNNLTIEEIQKLELEIAEKKIIEKIKLEKKRIKELDSKKENILIIGRWGYGNDAPELTDSLILLSYHKDKQHISMLSIPRDLYVEYWDVNKKWKKIKWKINWLYVHYLAKYNNEKKAITRLQEKIEEITGEKIDNYINIDFDWFVKLINSIDWITVNVKRNILDEEYPDINHWFQTFSISKGIKKIYWQTALKYARTRHNSGWDFWRSERQQQILKAIKDKILSNKYLTSPSKIKKLYNIFDKYITTDIWLIDFTRLATSIKLQNNLSFYSSTLNTTCIKKDECKRWWFLFYPQRKYFWWQSVLLSWNSTYKDLWNYDEIRKYSNIIFNSPTLFKENYKISIFSKLENREEAIELRQELKKYWLKINVLERIWNIPEINPDTLLGSNNIKVPDNGLRVIKKNIALETNNKNTKLIINWVNINSNTIKFLKRYLNLEKKDIIVNIGWPKYARDKNTRIEIIYKK